MSMMISGSLKIRVIIIRLSEVPVSDIMISPFPFIYPDFTFDIFKCIRCLRKKQGQHD